MDEDELEHGDVEGRGFVMRGRQHSMSITVTLLGEVSMRCGHGHQGRVVQVEVHECGCLPPAAMEVVASSISSALEDLRARARSEIAQSN
jgi:hypothetical protein